MCGKKEKEGEGEGSFQSDWFVYLARSMEYRMSDSHSDTLHDITVFYFGYYPHPHPHIHTLWTLRFRPSFDFRFLQSIPFNQLRLLFPLYSTIYPITLLYKKQKQTDR